MMELHEDASRLLRDLDKKMLRAGYDRIGGNSVALGYTYDLNLSAYMARSLVMRWKDRGNPQTICIANLIFHDDGGENFEEPVLILSALAYRKPVAPADINWDGWTAWAKSGKAFDAPVTIDPLVLNDRVSDGEVVAAYLGTLTSVEEAWKLMWLVQEPFQARRLSL
jgi:hypothetical protein